MAVTAKSRRVERSGGILRARAICGRATTGTMRGLLAVAAAALAAAAPAADLVPSLPGWTGALPSAWYSGYLNAGPGLHYHYTLIASENNPATDPIIFWQNGGPGCSSMEGLFAELGQLHVAGAVPGTAPTSPPSLY